MKEIKFKVTVNGKDEVEDLEKDVKKLDKTAKDTANGGFKEMAEASGAFRKELGLINRIKAVYNAGMKAMGVSTGAAAASTSGLTKGLQLLRVALIATGIGAIAVVVGTLASAFFSTQAGADALSKALTPVTTGLQAVWGVIQDVAVNFQQLIDGIVSGFQRVANIGLQLARGNFRQAFNETKSLVQDGIGVFTEFGNRVTDAYKQGADAGRELVELQIELEERQNAMIVPLARMNREYQELRTLSGDVAHSEEERLEAIEKALEIHANIVKEQQEQLDMEIEILQIKQDQNDTSREEDRELQELLARREELEQQAIRQNQNLTRRQSTILNGIEERQEKEAEAAAEREEQLRLEAEMEALLLEQQTEERINRQREINLRLRELDAANYEEELEIRAERAEFERELRLAEIEAEIEDEELRAAEIELVQAQFQEEMTSIEKEQSQARVALAEAEAQAKQDLSMEVANTLGALSRLVGEQTALGKAFAIVQATIDTYVGANKALAQGGIFGAVAAAGVIATGLANVRQITATKVPSIQGQPLGVSAQPPAQTAIPQPTFQPQALETVGTVFNGNQEDQRVYVVESDITDTQRRVNVTESAAAI